MTSAATKPQPQAAQPHEAHESPPPFLGVRLIVEPPAVSHLDDQAVRHGAVSAQLTLAARLDQWSEAARASARGRVAEAVEAGRRRHEAGAAVKEHDALAGRLAAAEGDLAAAQKAAAAATATARRQLKVGESPDAAEAEARRAREQAQTLGGRVESLREFVAAAAAKSELSGAEAVKAELGGVERRCADDQAAIRDELLEVLAPLATRWLRACALLEAAHAARSQVGVRPAPPPAPLAVASGVPRAAFPGVGAH